MEDSAMQQKECQLSVIVPIYNSEPYLHRCIDSILGQTFREFELILVDDGSSDGSGKICDGYVRQDKRVKVYHTENRGLVAARKIGLDHAQGKYIGFVDADDYIEPCMFDALLMNIVQYGADFVHTGYVEEHPDKSKQIYGFREGLFDLPLYEDREKFLLNYVLYAEEEKINNCIWSKLFRKELIMKCYSQLPEEQQFGEDLLCLCLCILESKRILLLKNALYHYIVRGKSLSHLTKKDFILENVGLYHCLVMILKNYNGMLRPDLKEGVCYYLLRDFMAMIEMVKSQSIKQQYFYIRNIDRFRGMRLALFGAGGVGQDYYTQLSKYKDIEVVAWIDSNWQNCQCEYADIAGLSSLHEYEYDKIIIAVKTDVMAKEIETKLIEYGISQDKIFWERPSNVLEEGLFNMRA